MNDEIRAKFKAAGVPQYLIAHQLGVSETTLVRWLRFPLSADKRSEILAALEELEEERDE